MSSPTATPKATRTSPAVTGFTLINYFTEVAIQKLNDGDVLYTDSLSTTDLSFRADTNPESVGSVVFVLNGDTRFNVESILPYKLTGYINGNYFMWPYKSGQQNVLKATPFMSADGSGDAGVPLEIRFTIIDGRAPKALPSPTVSSAAIQTSSPKSSSTVAPMSSPMATRTSPAVTGFTLINYYTEVAIQKLNDGDVLYTDSLGTTDLSFRADTNPQSVGSIGFVLNGDTRFHVESIPPYTLKGYINGDYFLWPYKSGQQNILKATPFMSADGSGDAGVPLEIRFTIIKGHAPQALPSPTVTKYTNTRCRKEDKNLGDDFATPEKCGAAARSDRDCLGNMISWSVKNNSCRCCSTIPELVSRDQWGVYQYKA
jgi:hypothetical protein